MHDFSAPAFDAFSHAALTLAIGAAAIVLVAAAGERVVAAAAIRRALWQSAILGILALMLFEVSGSSRALAVLWTRLGRIPAEDRAGDRERPVPTAPGAGAPVFAEDWAAGDDFGMGALALAQELGGEDQTAWFSGGGVEPVDESAESAPPVKISGGGSLSATSVFEPSRRWEWFEATVVLWGAVAVLLVGRIAGRRWRLARALGSWPLAGNEELAGEVAALCGRLGYRRQVRLGVAGRLPTPVALGLLRPTVLVPADFTRRFTSGQQRVILAHELSHLAAGDPAWLLAADLLAAILWWHPAVHWCRRRLETAAEQAADEASLLLPGGPDLLADCLVRLGRSLTRRPQIGWVAADGSGLRSGLARRVDHLLNLRTGRLRLPSRPITTLIKPALAGLMMVLAISCTLWVQPKATYAKGDDTMKALKVSWRQSLAAAALAAVLGSAGGATAGDEPSAPPKPAQLEQGSPADLILLAQSEERKEGDRPREGEKRPEADRPREGEKRPEADRPREGEKRAEGDRPREAAERPMAEARERMQAHREELRRRMEVLTREIGAMREKAQREGKPAEVGAMERELAEVQAQLKRLEMGDRGGPPREAVERLQALAQEIREHRAAGRIDAAEKLEREMAELRARLGGPREGDRPGPGERERAAGRERLAAMVREVQKLREAGKNEEAERLEREIDELHRRLAGPREGERPGPPADLRARIGRLRATMESLRAAGQVDQAEQVGRQLEELVRELPPEVRERAMAPGPPHEGMPELQGRIVDELRGEIERLRRESEEMRRMINELRAGQERLLRELNSRGK